MCQLLYPTFVTSFRENRWSLCFCTLVCTEAVFFEEKIIWHVMLVNHRRRKAMSFFYKKRPNIFLWYQIDFWIICNRFWSNYYLIRCQTKVLLYWLQFSLKPDCKNLGSEPPRARWRPQATPSMTTFLTFYKDSSLNLFLLQCVIINNYSL